jgi:hypothetical protein
MENDEKISIDPRILTPYPTNSKKHSDEAIKRLAESMVAVGFNRSVTVDKNCRGKLTVPEIPFSKINKMGAGMYKGLKRVIKAISDDQLESGGAIPTNTLQ